MSMLEIRNVNAFYGTAQALFDVSLDLNQGEIVALIGANGAGKTTLMRTISGLTLRRNGSIVFNGEEIIKAPSAKIVTAAIAQVLEGRNLFAGMTVEENLIMGAFLRKDKDGIAQDLEKVFGIFPRLKERRRQLAGKLSGGEQQMCAIARGLMSNPKLLLIDELSLGLAPVIIDELIDVVINLRSNGVSILLVEQDVQTGLSVSDRAYVLEHGHITLSGSSSELIKNEEIRRSYLGI